jgi:hypothetical protein
MSKTTKIVENILSINEEIMLKKAERGQQLIELKNRIASIVVLFDEIEISQEGAVDKISYVYEGKGYRLDIQPDGSMNLYVGGVAATTVTIVDFVENMEALANERISEERATLKELEDKLKE